MDERRGGSVSVWIAIIVGVRVRVRQVEGGVRQVEEGGVRQVKRGVRQVERGVRLGFKDGVVMTITMISTTQMAVQAFANEPPEAPGHSKRKKNLRENVRGTFFFWIRS